jgi:hypothetical protein
VNVLRSNLGAWGAGGAVIAGLSLSTIAAFAASPDQLYQTWQKNFLTDPDASEKAAEEYLRAAPQGPHAQDIKVWLDAYQKAMANLMAQSGKAGPTMAQNAQKQAPASKQAAAKPTQQAPQPKPQPSPAVKLAAAPPAPSKAAPAQHVVQDIKNWLHASQKATANLVTQAREAGQRVAQKVAQMAPQIAPKPAPASKLAAAKTAQQAPRPKSQPSPAAKLATAEPPKPAPAVGQAVAPPAPPKPVPPKPAPAQQLAHAVPPAIPSTAPAVKPATAPPPSARQPAAKQPETRTASAIARDNPARENEASDTAPPRPPAAKPPGQSMPGQSVPGQSVDGMLAFIADKVESEHPLDFTAVFINAAGGELVERLTYEASNVTIDPNRCQLSYRWHVVQDGRGMPDEDRAVQLRFSKGISVKTIDQALGELNDNRFAVHAAPQAYAVHIARWDKPSGDNLYFRDKDMAETVAGAVQQALELCDKASARFGN